MAKKSAPAPQVSAETKAAIERYMSLNERFKGAYFFTPPSNASGRRSYEEKNSFGYEGDGIKLSFDVTCSCNNVYVTKSICIDGRYTNATALKKYLK